MLTREVFCSSSFCPDISSRRPIPSDSQLAMHEVSLLSGTAVLIENTRYRNCELVAVGTSLPRIARITRINVVGLSPRLHNRRNPCNPWLHLNRAAIQSENSRRFP